MFKVGDLVKVVKDEHCCFSWIDEMNEYVGKTYRIVNIIYKEVYRQNVYILEGIKWYFSKSCLIPVNKTQIIEIKQKKNKVSAVLFENGKYIKHAIAKCHPQDTFDFEIGRDIAISRLLDLQADLPINPVRTKPNKEKFKPHLEFEYTGKKYGNIGEKTIQVDLANNNLFVGDTVDVYNKKRGYLGEYPVIKNEDYKNGAIQGVVSRIFQSGRNGEFSIIKKRSYKDVLNGEIVGFVKYIKEEI